MASVTRYSNIIDYDFVGSPVYGTMTKMNDGEYVLAADYDLLQRREAVMESCVRSATEALRLIGTNYNDEDIAAVGNLITIAQRELEKLATMTQALADQATGDAL